MSRNKAGRVPSIVRAVAESAKSITSAMDLHTSSRCKGLHQAPVGLVDESVNAHVRQARLRLRGLRPPVLTDIQHRSIVIALKAAVKKLTTTLANYDESEAAIEVMTKLLNELKVNRPVTASAA